ncbi:MAG: electron transfer flavoprotein subunit alpha/FixB family protein [Bacteroidales bacterium]|nr:electron transfer flavoprotein subunit alpha/FixB family protein [Bacteroidales bacterium]MDD2322343.1 electron transfer flavoprotein subunit alpha/FixB family protein [Bacteroidales bacterium]MDD3009871.1 electron transfer flavoprotein subunit alpha/FixB family protein [Bacteroidales bacterium]MDD3961482.1 electron transfer flavoprotein subunit alpha/FixB family protein [Bacteroidales bacterium]MDY0285145.1 electron transfer flavoprotein subunit alpha/FixB family protein [Bacteroidales bact
MQNILVYCEITEEGSIAEVSLELLSKGRKLAEKQSKELDALIIGTKVENVKEVCANYGVATVYMASHPALFPYTTLPHAAIMIYVCKLTDPQIALVGASPVGRDLAPRVASALRCGLTADCTSLVYGDHYDKKTETQYENLLYQIRPAFGGNIIATIINPDTRPQMATVREGVMKNEPAEKPSNPKVIPLDVMTIVDPADFALQIIERHIEPPKVDIKKSNVIIAGGYGVGSKEAFNQLFELAGLLGGEVAASRAAVDAGFVDSDRQVGQTGVTVRPKLYIGFGISGAVQHRAGMDQSAKIISVNPDPNAPLHQIADYSIVAKAGDVIPKMIRFFKANSK